MNGSTGGMAVAREPRPCQNRGRCGFRHFWNCTAVLARVAGGAGECAPCSPSPNLAGRLVEPHCSALMRRRCRCRRICVASHQARRPQHPVCRHGSSLRSVASEPRWVAVRVKATRFGALTLLVSAVESSGTHIALSHLTHET